MSAYRTLRARGCLTGLMVLVIGMVAHGAAWSDEAAPPKADASRLESIFDGFYSVELDTEHPLEVQDFTLSKDAMDFTFKKGRIYLAKPLEGEVTGAYFVGEGTMKLVAPNKTEKKALKRGYGKEVFEESITEVVMRFDDGTDKQLAAAGKPAPPGAAGTESLGTWAARNGIEYNGDNLQLDFLEKKIGGVTGRDFFVADANTAGAKWIAFEDRARFTVEISLYQVHALGVAGKRGFENWCAFHKKEDYDVKGNYTLLPEADDKNPAVLRDVKMTVVVPSVKTLRIEATEEVVSLVDHLGLLRFDLVNNIHAASWNEKGMPVEVELVTDGSGVPLPYIHKWHELVVIPPHPLARGEKTSIRVKATESTFIEHGGMSHMLYSDYPWLPQMGNLGGRYTFDWTVKLFMPLSVAGSGDLVKEWEEGKLGCSEWRSDIPVHIPSLLFGNYVTADSTYKSEAPGAGTTRLRLFSERVGKHDSALNEENVLYNVQQGLKAYESLFGPYAYHELHISEMSASLGFSQSPPGILFIGGMLRDTGGGGMGDQTVFHELAHQWWGNQVGWTGPEDTWISESWAEYSAGLITQAISQSKFDAMRKQWKKDALVANPTGTIATAEWSKYRNGLLYDKGPYVVHMLRTWLGWEKFAKLVSTIQSKYKNQDINTDTIARETSALMGYDMFPFFDQWVRDQGIPKVHYSWTSESDADGKILVTIRTRQEDKENFKILMVPVSFDFGKEKPVVVMKPIMSAEAEIKVKVPVKPKDVRLDDEASQLAEFIHDKQ